jgi:hypothetical protein
LLEVRATACGMRRRRCLPLRERAIESAMIEAGPETARAKRVQTRVIIVRVPEGERRGEA